ncbi:hypothetical protein BAUCODRAFT_126288 [Baudoinia panamericana UAMH 10762]|uniref:Uncharacterized protein n=1 Tax=Baudoinia panamericana (strain UAMH 10762) TaxID=717646 RepID=M2N0Z0_BAUPA|nr:uncharacterized protein BAUCODRAFT_126288 [Baudoinia panamericana UAMH 10762]EMC92300.1 hypothetical protein BAUCODRAFT_126288 [Baudoinia panamericana UAMH 10762]
MVDSACAHGNRYCWDRSDSNQQHCSYSLTSPSGLLIPATVVRACSITIFHATGQCIGLRVLTSLLAERTPSGIGGTTAKHNLPGIVAIASTTPLAASNLDGILSFIWWEASSGFEREVTLKQLCRLQPELVIPKSPCEPRTQAFRPVSCRVRS